jgi:hypothetical protein
MHVKNNASSWRPGGERYLRIAMQACISIGESSDHNLRGAFLANCEFRIPIVLHSPQVQPTAEFCISLASTYDYAEDRGLVIGEPHLLMAGLQTNFPLSESIAVGCLHCQWSYEQCRFPPFPCHPVSHKVLAFETVEERNIPNDVLCASLTKLLFFTGASPNKHKLRGP